jgi:hypothetical protein
MADADTRGLLVLFEPELTLSLLPMWWIEVPCINVLGLSYNGIVIDDLVFFNWLIARDGSVLGVTFFPPEDLPDTNGRGLRSSLESLSYVEDVSGMPIIWFSEKRGGEVDSSSCILQDFAAAIYVAEPASWGLVLNIDWLPVAQRDQLGEISARWVDAECKFVEPGEGVSLCKGLPFPALYQLRDWFRSGERL